MKVTGRVATWLDVAAAAHSHDARITLCVHPLLQADNEIPPKRRNQCPYGITFMGRWLHSSNGRLTVLKGRDAVDRFIRLIGISFYESGQPAQLDVDCGKTSHCLAVGRNRSLQACA